MSENQEEIYQGKSITQLSKEAIKEVFQHFDIDKSGFIEYDEIELLANELKMKENEIQECKEAMKQMDINEDGKISFEEFWDWWRRGGAGQKMDNLIYMKLKAMKLLNKAHSEFIRFGGSLESQYESKIDTHFISINYMEDYGNLVLKLLGLFNNKDLIEERQNQLKGIQTDNQQFQENLEKKFIGIVFRFKYKEGKGEEAKMALEKLFKDFVKLFRLYNYLGIFYELFDKAQIEVQIIEQEIVGYLKVDESKINVVENDQKIGKHFKLFMTYLKLSNLKLESLFSLRNGFKQILDSLDEQFVKTMLYGFIAQVKIQMNQGYLKKFRNIIKAKLEQELGIYEEKQFKISFVSLTTLLNSSKFKVSFKNIDDIDDFFSALGLNDLVNSQPTNRDLIEELQQDQTGIFRAIKNNLQQEPDERINKQVDSEAILILKLIGIIIQMCADQGDLSFHYKTNLVKFSFSASGLSEFLQNLCDNI